MNWADLGKNIIKFGAPILGGAVAGPAGAALGGTLAAMFGADPDSPKDILRKIKADPDAAIKLLEIQSKERIKIAETDKANFEIKVGDVKSARAMAIKKIELGKEDNTPRNLAYMLTIGLFIIIQIVLFVKIQPDALGTIELMIGFWSAGTSAAWGFYLGSSAGSKKKDDMIRSQKMY